MTIVKKALFAGVASWIFVVAGTARAQDPPELFMQLEPAPKADSDHGPTRKFGRGLANLSCGWMEIPKNIEEVKNEQNLLAGMTWGVAKGVKDGTVRTVVGAYEMATFPLPVGGGYEPVIKPEFIFDIREDK